MDDYAGRLSERAERLQQLCIRVDNRTRRSQDRVEEVRARLERDLQEAGRQLIELQEETAAVADRVKRLLGRFQRVVKQGDLERLQSRVDAWGPEKKISREVFERMLS